MAESIIAAFDTASEALIAARELKRAGFNGEAITIMSDEPIHTQGELLDGRKSFIGMCAIAGGVIGASAAVLLTVTTSRQMSLVTGGMPIVAPWALGIIVFELTALGAIFATLGCMIYESKLIRPGALKQYNPEVADGKIIVAVDCPGDAEAELATRAFAVRGAQIYVRPEP
jgi:hypothetical protein